MSMTHMRSTLLLRCATFSFLWMGKVCLLLYYNKVNLNERCTKHERHLCDQRAPRQPQYSNTVLSWSCISCSLVDVHAQVLPRTGVHGAGGGDAVTRVALRLLLETRPAFRRAAGPARPLHANANAIIRGGNSDHVRTLRGIGAVRIKWAVLRVVLCESVDACVVATDDQARVRFQQNSSRLVPVGCASRRRTS